MIKIPIIDLFAGPGGLGEGFSSVFENNNRVFDIKLSIEKEENAHRTLELRSFFRKFKKGEVPTEYYDVLKEKNLLKRGNLIYLLYEKYPEESLEAKNEAWLAELGGKNFPSSKIDERITTSLKGSKEWLLIGGPPCQAFSLVGRSRVGGIDETDHRVYLYQEYLRIIAVHHPTVFVMENVKGLLSAELEGEKVFDLMRNDLNNLASVFEDSKAPKYKIFSLSTDPSEFDTLGNPLYNNIRDYLIQSEKFGVPQKRHRVILLGIRQDINAMPSILKQNSKEANLKSVIGDLPPLRSGLGRSIISSTTVNGVKKRVYKKEVDSNLNWERKVNEFRTALFSWKGLESEQPLKMIKASPHGLGSEYIEYKTPSKENPLKKWYHDENLKGVCNHETRSHLIEDLKRYLFAGLYAEKYKRFPRLKEYEPYSSELMPDHVSATTGKFADRFRVQMPDCAATTITSHISKDGHYFIHYDPKQCRSLTVREAARIQTFPDNYLFFGPRTAQYHQVGNAVPPYLAYQIAEIVASIFKEL
ncbi:DNA cytosine methyltransferase [Flavobacterium sp.]|uniref:DNA cytosine methyltransferase n=1 Tax=Flavobacterium sp. TaxID=239 RepID=UPI002B4AE5F3|nr:DNA cytosine methyltransferase [Flavobacterium sp.]HLF52566.1 DNA cytosine methyltransferase [Flavobacterium sp.]